MINCREEFHKLKQHRFNKNYVKVAEIFEDIIKWVTQSEQFLEKAKQENNQEE